jgi:pimeloyl-ACP methyl ester carboxylesterase
MKGPPDGTSAPAREEGFLRVGGRRLEYARWAAAREGAPTLVFLHEGLGSVSLWRDFPARAAGATGRAALAYSRAGYGRSDPGRGPWGVDFMHREAALLPEVLDAAGVADAVLVGHSDGASIALIHAGSDPSPRVRALALLAPHVFVEDVTVRSIARLVRACRETDLPARFARHHGANTAALLDAWTGIWLAPEFRGWNLEEHLPRVAAPVLVVQGEADEYGTMRQVEAVRRGVPGPVRTLLLPGAGHAPHHDAPGAVLAALTAFVEGLGPAAP